MSTLGERLELAMQADGMTQADLARAIHVTRSAIHQAIRGASKGLKPHHLILVCRQLRIRPEWLALGEEPMRPDPTLRDFYALPPAKQKTIASVIRDMTSHYG